MVDWEDTPTADSGVGIAASLGPRFLARLIDSFLIGFASVYGIWMAGDVGVFTVSLLSVAIVIAYFTLMESYTGRTVGKMLLKLKTIGPDGGNPSLEMAFRRNGWYLLSIVPYIGGLGEIAAALYIAMTISRSPANIGWHDTFAGGTRVVPVGR